jgi:hypothetical protein
MEPEELRLWRGEILANSRLAKAARFSTIPATCR